MSAVEIARLANIALAEVGMPECVTIVPRVAVYDWQRDPELAVDDCAPHGMARPDTTEAAS